MDNYKIPKKKTRETKDFWLHEIELAEKAMDHFHRRGQAFEGRYRCDDALNSNGFDSNYNIFYSNTETILPILINEPAKLDVRAVNPDVLQVREAAKMLEDSLGYNANQPCTFEVIKKAVKDYLIAGLGVVRVCYDPVITERENVKTDIDNNGNIVEEREIEEKLVFEEIRYEFINYSDLIFPDCKDWSCLPWIAFKGFYTYDQVKEKFGKQVASSISYEQYDAKDNNIINLDASQKFGLALIYEVWDKTNKKVIFVCKNGDANEPLKVEDDPLELDEFFPIARPLRSITTNNTLYPVPFFVEYQDLAEELNEVSARIRANIDNLKRRGIYDESVPELQNLPEMGDNSFIPAKSYQEKLAMSGKGDLSAFMVTEDLTNQVAVLNSLYTQRAEIIQAIYQVTGYSDIIRGQTDPRETLGAQKMKGRYSTLRISEQQREVQRFIRDTFRLAGEIIVNKFEPKTIALQTSVPIEKVGVYQLTLRQTEPASAYVDIQTDSTIEIDDFSDKQEITEFITSLSGFVQQVPALVQVLGLEASSQLLLTMLQKFKLGRDIEQAVMDQIKKAMMQEQQPKPPSPEEIQQQMEMQKFQVETQLEMAKIQLEREKIRTKQAEIGLKDQESKTKIDLEGIKTTLSALNDEAKLQLEKDKIEAEAANPDDNAVVGA